MFNGRGDVMAGCKMAPSIKDSKEQHVSGRMLSTSAECYNANEACDVVGEASIVYRSKRIKWRRSHLEGLVTDDNMDQWGEGVTS